MDLTIKIIVAVVALGCGSAAYILFNRKYRIRNAVDAFNYLTIKTVVTEKKCDAVIQDFYRHCIAHKAVGFDCEWVTDHGKRHPVALVQLSSYDGLTALFRLNQMKMVPESLKNFLEDKNIYKVGVAPGDDAKYLHQDYSVYVCSTLDIRHIAELCGYDPGGLASLARSLLRVVLDKNWRVRCSDWEAEELTKKQIDYAAADAHVAIKIFVKLLNEYESNGLFSWITKKHNIRDCLENYRDVNYKTKQKLQNVNSLTMSRKLKEVQDNEMSSVLSKRYPNATRTKPLYHNCFLQAPDGELLCTCDNKKAFWYVEKELATIVSQEPLTVRLRFEPAGRSRGTVGRYYQLAKQNCCVVCGSTNSYIRKNVVPREYRKYFPEVMKDHSSHDVVLLCIECHQRSNINDQAVRERLAVMCNAPLSSHEKMKYTEDADSKKVRSAARALLYQSQKHTIPEPRRMELGNLLLEHFPTYDQVTVELLEEAAKLQIMFENIDYEAHGLKVTDYFKKNDGLLHLEEMWREHFLTSMRPKFMPELWSLKHNEERDSNT